MRVKVARMKRTSAGEKHFCGEEREKKKSNGFEKVVVVYKKISLLSLNLVLRRVQAALPPMYTHTYIYIVTSHPLIRIKTGYTHTHSL